MRPLSASPAPAPRAEEPAAPAVDAGTAEFGMALMLALLGQVPPPPPILTVSASGTAPASQTAEGTPKGAADGQRPGAFAPLTTRPPTVAVPAGAPPRGSRAGLANAIQPSLPEPTPDLETESVSVSSSTPRGGETPSHGGAIRVPEGFVSRDPRAGLPTVSDPVIRAGAPSSAAAARPLPGPPPASASADDDAPASRPTPKPRPASAPAAVEAATAPNAGPSMASSAAVSGKTEAPATVHAAPRPEAPAAPANAAPPQGRRATDQVTLRLHGEDGLETTLRVSARGAALRATIVSADPAATTRLEHGLGELQRALAERGFTQARVSVQQAGAIAESASPAAARPDAREAREETREERHPHPGDPRDPDHTHHRRRSTRQDTER